MVSAGLAAEPSAPVDERQLVLDVPQQRGGGVALGRLQLNVLRPGDGDVGVVVGDAPLDLAVVVGRLLVHDVGLLAEHTEAMREADRAVELVEVLVGELEGLPLAEGRRPAPEVHHHVKDRAARAAHELGRPVADLEVHAPHDALSGTRVVVLHELLGNAEVGVHVAPVALVEEAPLVAMDHGLHQHWPLEPCFSRSILSPVSSSSIGPFNVLLGRRACVSARRELKQESPLLPR